MFVGVVCVILFRSCHTHVVFSSCLSGVEETRLRLKTMDRLSFKQSTVFLFVTGLLDVSTANWYEARWFTLLPFDSRPKCSK